MPVQVKSLCATITNTFMGEGVKYTVRFGIHSLKMAHIELNMKKPLTHQVREEALWWDWLFPGFFLLFFFKAVNFHVLPTKEHDWLTLAPCSCLQRSLRPSSTPFLHFTQTPPELSWVSLSNVAPAEETLKHFASETNKLQCRDHVHVLQGLWLILYSM